MKKKKKKKHIFFKKLYIYIYIFYICIIRPVIHYYVKILYIHIQAYLCLYCNYFKFFSGINYYSPSMYYDIIKLLHLL